MRYAKSVEHRSPASIEADTFNAAFDKPGLEWRWDAATIGEFGADACDQDRVSSYVHRHHPHLLKVYDADFLGELVVATKQRQAETQSRLPHAAPQQHTHA
ncbi:MAG: hypothetical protein ABI552_05970 [Casimicrobiaceae bacterium]